MSGQNDMDFISLYSRRFLEYFIKKAQKNIYVMMNNNKETMAVLLLLITIQFIISNLNTRDVIYTPVLLNFARLLNAPQRYLELCCNETDKIYMYINFISKSKKT